MEAHGGGAEGSHGEGDAGEVGHDEGVGGGGVGGLRDEERDAGAIYIGRVGRGGLGKDGVGWAVGGKVGDGAGFEAEALDGDGGGALGLADGVGDLDLLGAEGLGDADLGVAADGLAGGGGLADEVAGGDGGGVEAVLDGEGEALGVGALLGVGDGEAGEAGDVDLAAVDGEAHGDEGGEERDREHGQRAEGEVEETEDAALCAHRYRV